MNKEKGGEDRYGDTVRYFISSSSSDVVATGTRSEIVAMHLPTTTTSDSVKLEEEEEEEEERSRYAMHSTLMMASLFFLLQSK